jgi:thiol-disulfide isomerase/thioredoxin
MKTIIITLLAISVTFIAKSQNVDSIYPEVGKPMPDFKFNDVQYYSKKQAGLADFKGQWLILDCWNRYCGVCLRAMPKINALQEKFKGKVQFLMVGYTGSQYTKKSDDKAIRKLYKMNRKMGNLNLTIAFDSTLFHRFDIWATPYVMIVDPTGIVRGITYKISEQNINDLLAGNHVELAKAYRFQEKKQMRKERDSKIDSTVLK